MMRFAVMGGMALAAALVAAAPARSQSGPVPASPQAARYGLATAEWLGNRGAQVRRIFFSDSRARDAGALSFTRRPGQKPRVSFQLPLQTLQDAATAEISPSLWRRIVERSRDFYGARFTPPANGVCAGTRVFLVEAADPPGRAPARRRSVDMCAGAEFPLWLAETAAQAIPSCGLLDRDRFGDGLEWLSVCARLGGDRNVAARVFNAAGSFLWLDQPDHVAALRAAFASGVTLDWRGDRVTGREAAIGRWRSGIAERPNAEFYWSRVRGLSGGRAELDGYFIDTVRDENDSVAATYRSVVTMSVTLAPDNRLSIGRARVAPFVRVAPSA